MKIEAVTFEKKRLQFEAECIKAKNALMRQQTRFLWSMLLLIPCLLSVVSFAKNPSGINAIVVMVLAVLNTLAIVLSQVALMMAVECYEESLSSLRALERSEKNHFTQ